MKSIPSSFCRSLLSTMKRVNFQNPGPLTSISEGQPGEDSGSLASEDLGMEFERARPRHHSIQEIIAAKAASKVFKAKMLAARKTKRRDDGLVEVITDSSNWLKLEKGILRRFGFY